jgi:hypothetical protein
MRNQYHWICFALVSLLVTFAGCVGDDNNYRIDRNGGNQVDQKLGRLAAGGTTGFIFKEDSTGFWSGQPQSGFERIDRAWTGDPSVAVVSRINEGSGGRRVDGFFSVRTKRPGKTSLHVTSAWDDGEATIELHVSRAVKLKFGKARCLNLSTPYLVGMAMNFDYALFDKDMVRLGGNIGEVPFTVEPAAALNERHVAQPPGGEVALRSKVDETVRQFRIVDAGGISDLSLVPAFEWEPGQGVTRRVAIRFEAHGRNNGKALCGEPDLANYFEFEVVSFTPEICSAAFSELNLSLRKVGNCRFRVTFPDVNNGQGWSAERSIQIVEPDYSQDGDQ